MDRRELERMANAVCGDMCKRFPDNPLVIQFAYQLYQLIIMWRMEDAFTILPVLMDCATKYASGVQQTNSDVVGLVTPMTDDNESLEFLSSSNGNPLVNAYMESSKKSLQIQYKIIEWIIEQLPDEYPHYEQYEYWKGHLRSIENCLLNLNVNED